MVVGRHKDKDGYTFVRRRRGTRVRSHRLIYEQCFGEIPKGAVIRHKCDEPSCINPEHLEIGTPKDNTQDMIDRGRYIVPPIKVGENNGNAVISMDIARTIRRHKEEGMTYREMQREFGVSAGTITVA